APTVRTSTDGNEARTGAPEDETCTTGLRSPAATDASGTPSCVIGGTTTVDALRVSPYTSSETVAVTAPGLESTMTSDAPVETSPPTSHALSDGSRQGDAAKPLASSAAIVRDSDAATC